MIGERTPHSRRHLSNLTPQCPTNLQLLPETVRSGTGSYPKPPAHGPASDRTNFGFRKETGFDDPKVKLTGVGPRAGTGFCVSGACHGTSAASPPNMDDGNGARPSWSRDYCEGPAPRMTAAPRIAPGSPDWSTDCSSTAQPAFLVISLAGSSKRCALPCHMPAACIAETAFQ